MDAKRQANNVTVILKPTVQSLLAKTSMRSQRIPSLLTILGWGLEVVGGGEVSRGSGIPLRSWGGDVSSERRRGRSMGLPSRRP